MENRHRHYLLEAVKLAKSGMETGEGGPFGCVIVKDELIVGRGHNRVLATNDPTAHAEIVAIREACATLNSFQLEGCTLYSTCEPCPMCLGAIYWARPALLIYAANRNDAASIGFDDAFIYRELDVSPDQRTLRTEQLPLQEVLELMQRWTETGKFY
jgi:tRNA(Arg) A34 adenosine deaminase TadA